MAVAAAGKLVIIHLAYPPCCEASVSLLVIMRTSSFNLT